ncbi:conserved membrane hypothetical protein [Crenothrix polyspora]|uniref:Transmembrane protein n=1 Tax=Crenothrix polyspora TaxID=360316 RepID=A0A1R4H7I5_9GAMM|nr:DUF2069 domain-containing protein [Crenothrix polyspora]SJM91810.1 conserved membrane hypothetical protein [Crenothrix polyspora]
MKINSDYYYYLSLVGFFGLFIWLMAWHTVLAADAAKFPVALMLIITVTPLLLPMRGLLNRNKRSCAWAAYISLAYFIHGAAETYINADQRFYLSLEVLFSLMLFFGTTFYVRFVGKTT